MSDNWSQRIYYNCIYGKEMSGEWFSILQRDCVQGLPACIGSEVMSVDEGIFESRLRILNRGRRIIVGEMNGFL